MESRKYSVLILLLIICVGAILRFYNLLWGSPYFFNPDERNMAAAITQFKLPANLFEIRSCVLAQLKIINNQSEIINKCNLNPHFFAYGHFPLYLAYFSGILIRSDPLQVTFPQAIFWLRFWSALASTLTIIVVYGIMRIVCEGFFERNRRPSQIAALFVAFTPGFIQAAHMGTTESLLTFFFALTIFLSLSILKAATYPALLRRVLLLTITLGLALGTKLSAVVFLSPIILPLALRWLLDIASEIELGRRHLLASIAVHSAWFTLLAIFIAGGSLALALTTSPYVVFDYGDFYNISKYEIDVARGLISVFYTRQFVNTTPILFQLEKIFPYALGPVLSVLGLLGIVYSTILVIVNMIRSIRQRHRQQTYLTGRQTTDNPSTPFRASLQLFVLLVSFFTYFLPNAFLFTKWTRFMTPIMPLFAVFAVIVIQTVSQRFVLFIGKCQIIRKLGYCLIGLLVIIALLPGAAFMFIYTHGDVRFTASRWIYQNIPSGTMVLSETANVIDIPIPSSGSSPPENYRLSPVSFDFYHLDVNPQIQQDLIKELANSEYIFVPSRRLFANVMRSPEIAPITNRYYQALFSGTLGFAEVARFTSFPRLEAGGWKQEAADEAAEETWTVFDHPVVRTYRKVTPMTREEYQQLLGI